MKKLSSMSSFHGTDAFKRRKKAPGEEANKRPKEEEEGEEEEGEEEEEEGEQQEEGGRKKLLERSKSFKLKLLQKMGRGKDQDASKKRGTSKDKKVGVGKAQLKRRERELEKERRKEETIKNSDRKAELESTSHVKEIPSTVMCGLNLPGYKAYRRASGSSASRGANNRGRGEKNNHNPLWMNDKEDRTRDKERKNLFSPSSPSGGKNESEETQKKKEKRRSFLHGTFKRDHSQSQQLDNTASENVGDSEPPPTSPGLVWVRGEREATATDGGTSPPGRSRFDSGDSDYVERGEEGIDLIELQRRFQGVVGGDEEEERRRVRLAEDRVKGAARIPWWGLNASSGKEGRRKEWERFFSGFRVCELWEDEEDEDEEDDYDGCGRGMKVAWLTEETTVKEALDAMSDRRLNALPICLKELSESEGAAQQKALGRQEAGSQEDEVRERALRHLRKWRKAELVRERERKQRKQPGRTVLGWLDLRDLLTFAVFKFPWAPSQDVGIDEVRRQGVEFTQHKIGELVNIYGMNGAQVVNEEGTGAQSLHRISANDRMPAVFRMLRSEKGLRVLPVYDQSQLPAESRTLVRVLDTNVVLKWLHRVVESNRARSPFVRDLANRQVRHWGAFAETILGKELIYFETEEMINNFDHFRASKRGRRMSKMIAPYENEESTTSLPLGKPDRKNPSPPPTPTDHPKEKLDLNKHLFTISADRSVIDAFKVIYNYKVSALGVLEKKGKEKNVDDVEESSSDDDDDTSEEEEVLEKKRRDQAKAKGPCLKEVKAKVAADDSSDDSSSDEEEESSETRSSSTEEEEESSDESCESDDVSTTREEEGGQKASATANQRTLTASRTAVESLVSGELLGAIAQPRRAQSDPVGLVGSPTSRKANDHDASDTARANRAKGRKPRLTKPITREEMVVRAAEAGKLISHLSSSDLKNFEPFAMMRCLHMSIKEYLSCFKEKKPLVTCRRDTTLAQLLAKMAREEVNRVWLLADEDDDDDDEGEGGEQDEKKGGEGKGHERKAEASKGAGDRGGRPIGMISLADIITEVTRV